MRGGLAVVRHIFAAPTRTHWRRATCEEVDCVAWREGWVVDIDTNQDPGAGQALFLRSRRDRWRFTEEPLPGNRTRFRFPAGQTCLKAAGHRIRNRDVPGVFAIAADGQRPRVVSPEQWTNEFGETLDRLAAIQNRR